MDINDKHKKNTDRILAIKYIPHLSIYDFDVSPDGETVALGGKDDSVLILDIAKPHFLYVYPLEGHSNTISSVAWSPDSKLLASGSYDNTVRIWNIGYDSYLDASMEEEALCLEYSSKIWSVSFSPDGEKIVVVTEEGLSAIDIREQTLLLDLSGSPLGQLGTCLNWSSDGSLMAAGTFDGKCLSFLLKMAV